MKKLIIFLLIALPFVMNAQKTYVPDDNFEQALIDFGFDTPPLNDSIPTKNIDTVRYLDVSHKNISDLTGIEAFKELDTLFCEVNQLSNLHIYYNKKLKYLNCSRNLLTSLSVGNNMALTKLVCYTNQLTKLDLSRNNQLAYLDCSENQLSSVNIDNCTSLKTFDCSLNLLYSLDINSCSELEYFSCNNNSLYYIDFNKNLNIKEINCVLNKLTYIDLSKNHNLTRLHCYSNKLTYLNLKNGNNYKMNGENEIDIVLQARNNQKLLCIIVDDSAWSANNVSWKIDAVAHYSTDCGYTGVEEYKSENESISVSPNPATDYIEINVPRWRWGEHHSAMFTGGVSIFDVLGDEVLKGMDSRVCFAILRERGNDSQFPEGTIRIDISSLPPGVYFVRVGDVVRKFVKM